jgi:hypothetical protein
MTAYPPPIPLDQQSRQHGGAEIEAKDARKPSGAADNLREQDWQGSTKQNTTNKGFQQDR